MITGLLPTRNRPDFLLRTVRYYARTFPHPLVIADGSSDAGFETIRASFERARLPSTTTLMHHAPDVPYVRRLADALAKVETPYVVLMADDDLFFEGWAEKSVAYLEKHPDCGVAWGHTIHFQLDDYVPYGEVRRFIHQVPNPVARWMEQDSPVDRLRELGQGPWTTVGWYAVQRTSILRDLVDKALAADFDPEMFERLMILLQPIHGKVAMLDTLCLARQFSPLERQPSRYVEQAEAFKKLEAIAVDTLVSLHGLGPQEAEDAVRSALKPEISALSSNDRRARINLEVWKTKIPFAVSLMRGLRRLGNRVKNVDPLAEDPRFPAKPDLSPSRPELVAVREACKSTGG